MSNLFVFRLNSAHNDHFVSEGRMRVLGSRLLCPLFVWTDSEPIVPAHS